MKKKIKSGYLAVSVILVLTVLAGLLAPLSALAEEGDPSPPVSEETADMADVPDAGEGADLSGTAETPASREEADLGENAESAAGQDEGQAVAEEDKGGEEMPAAETPSGGKYAYVSSAEMAGVEDGSAPWDLSDTPGNDSSPHNGLVRTYDTIVYNPSIAVSSLSNENYTKGTVWFSCELPMDISRARYDTDLMSWMQSYRIEYFNKSGQVVATGENRVPDYSANKATGSGDGTNSYRTDVVRQVLTGSYEMRGAAEGTVVIPGTQTLSVAVKVTNACNGDIVQPSFDFWMEGNQDNLNRSGKRIDTHTIPSTTVVSAKARYDLNLQMVDKSYTNILGYFDLKNGSVTATERDGTLRGRMQGYSVNVQLYNETDNPKISLSSKKFKGIELPQGDMTYNIQWRVKDPKNNLPKSGVTPILWNYSNNVNSQSASMVGSRMLAVNGSFMYGVCISPAGSTYSGKDVNSTDNCLYKEGKTIVQGEIPTDMSQVSGYETPAYTVTVSGYDFDLDKMRFPNRNFGNSYTTAGLNEYIGIYAVSYFEVVLQDQNPDLGSDGIKTIYLEGEVSNMQTHALSGKLVNQEVPLNDNVVFRDVTLRVPGSISKGTQFTYPEATWPYNTGNFTSTYTTPDGSVIPGGTAGVWASVQMSRSGDNAYNSSDVLLKFDTHAFDIERKSKLFYALGGISSTSRITFAYAADPLFPDGYNSNDPISFARMNTATTQDFTYFKSLEDLEKAGFTCTAVLMETRGDVFPNRSDQRVNAVRVILKAKNDPSLVGKTYAAITYAEGWTDTQNLNYDISWLTDATNNLTKVDRTLTSYKNTERGQIPGTVINNNPKIGYIKAEFNENGIIPGTNAGGWTYGSTVMIVPCKALVTAEADYPYYDLGKGQRTASWTIHPSSSLGTAGNAVSPDNKTDLTVTIRAGEGQSLMSGSYSMGGVSLGDGTGVMVLYTYRDAKGAIHEDQFKASFQIGSDGSLTVKCADVAAGAALPDIGVKTLIGKAGSPDDVVNNQLITINASITGTNDIRPLAAYNGNIASASSRIIKLNETALYKDTGKAVLETNEEFANEVTYSNILKQSDVGPFKLIDILPYNGDGRNSAFHGTYTVRDITVSFSSENGSAEVYAAKGQLGSNADALTWDAFGDALEKIGETSGGTVTIPAGFSVSGIGIRASGLPNGAEMTVRYTIVPEGNHAGDIYSNSASALLDGSSEDSALQSNIVQSVVAERSLSGTVWIDRDGKGELSAGERRLAGQTVTLYKKTGDGWTNDFLNANGEKVEPVKTDSSGYYSFGSLAPGVYEVRIDDIPGFSGVTVQNAPGVPYALSSKAVRDGNGALIDSVSGHSLELPEAPQMTSPYFSIPDLNAGIILAPASADISFVKTGGQGKGLAGAEFALYKYDGSGSVPDLEKLEKLEETESGEDGKFGFSNLKAGEYFVAETKAPRGSDSAGGQA